MKARPTMRHCQRKTPRLVPRPLCVLATACACVLVAVCVLIAPQMAPKARALDSGYTPGVIDDIPGLPPLAYDGNTVEFTTADMQTRFGMFSNDKYEDMRVSLKNGKVHISFTPNNRTIYAGFYLNASIADESTWTSDRFIKAIGDASYGTLAYDFELDDSYCGRAWPITPLKIKAGSGKSGGGDSMTTVEQYYIFIPPIEKIPYTATFTDWKKNALYVVQVVAGQVLSQPADPSIEGYTFGGWFTDANCTVPASFGAVLDHDVTIYAKWTPNGTSHTVTFMDGDTVLLTYQILDGDNAVAPDDPTRDGFIFDGWDKDSSEFENVKSDLTVHAKWIDRVQEVHNAIAALPSDPKTLVNKTDNAAVASAGDMYLSLQDDLKAKLSDKDRLHLAKCAIAVLPSDPFKVTSAHKTPIERAQSIVKSLPNALQEALDSDSSSGVVFSSYSYGRYLEIAVWSLDSLRTINNVSLLKTGTYTGQVTSSSNMGKSTSKRGTSFTVKSVTVNGGLATAIVEHSSNSYQTLRLGGVDYPNLQTDSSKNSYFEIPIDLNSTFHFSAKGKNATDATPAIAFEMTVTADESSMTPDAEDSGDGDSDSADSGTSGSGSGSNSGSGTGTSASGTTANLNSLVKNTSTSTGAKTTASNSASSSAAAAKDEKSASAASARTSTSGSTDTGSASVKEISMSSSDGGSSSASNGELIPAVAGCALFFVSAGVLAFTLRFLRRESV